jgi:hypothetical protein
VEAHFSLGMSSTFDSVLVVSTIIKLLFFLLSLLPTFEGASNDEELMFLVTSNEENY